MNRRNLFRLVLLLALALFVFAADSPALAQSKSVVVSRRDVNIQILTNGDEQFEEVWHVQFRGGPFTFAFRGIAMHNLESVDGFQVSEGGQVYRSSTGGSANTFQVYDDEGQRFVKWFFPPTTNQTRTFSVKYTIHGALRIYPDGDQLYSKVIESDREYTIESSRVLVKLPSAFSSAELKTATYFDSIEGPGGRLVDPSTVEFTGGPFPPGTEWEVRVQFPHGVVTASPPAWQALADARPVLNLLFLFIGVVLAIAGPLALYLLWFAKGRDAPVRVVAQTSAPPSDLPPGMVGTLIDERADMKDIIASIVDLARRGVLKMTEKEEAGFLGIGKTRDFVFELVGDTSNLRAYEQTLIQRIFSGGATRELSDLKERFYTAIPTLKDQMYKEVVKAGYFPGNPNATRTMYAMLGIAALLLFGCAGFVLWSALSDLADLAWCPLAALVAGAAGLVIISPFMPRRSLKGATERAKWVAFKRYLEGIEKYTKLEEAQDLFDKYLPYAISFGLEKSWTQKFAAIGTPAPTWYETYPPIMYGGHPRPRPGYGTPGHAGAGGSVGGSGPGGSIPTLDQAAGRTFAGLDSMATGLFSMLDSTASVLSSAPASQGGGGGGWSGGGGGGGGGSGGGSSGFG